MFLYLCMYGVGGKRGSTDSDCGGGSHDSTRVDIKWRIQRKRKVVNILPLTIDNRGSML